MRKMLKIKIDMKRKVVKTLIGFFLIAAVNELIRPRVYINNSDSGKAEALKKRLQRISLRVICQSPGKFSYPEATVGQDSLYNWIKDQNVRPMLKRMIVRRSSESTLGLVMSGFVFGL
jgi:hypothetical protein